MSSRGVRVARGLLSAAVATFAAAFFHGVGGGLPPSGLALALCLTFSGLICIALAGRSLSWWRLTGSVLISQFLFHILFTLNPSGHVIGATEHVHLGAHLVFVPGAAQPAMSMTQDGVAMWASHALAALTTIAYLRYGEHVFWALCEFSAFQLRRIFRDSVAVPIGSIRRVRVETIPLTLPSPALILGQLRHRGPPALLGQA